MSKVSPVRRCLPAVLMFLGLALALGTPARAQMTEYLPLPELVKRADQIMVGKCTARRVGVENGIIVTHYKVKPEEFWKGQRTLSADGDFTITELGGVLENSPVPLGQYVPGTSDMLPGEDVLLFLADPMPPQRPSKAPAPSLKGKGAASRTAASGPSLQNSPSVIGRWQGRYSVITNPRSGKKTVAHTNISPVPGSPLNNVMREKLLQAQGVKIQSAGQGTKVAALEKVALPKEKILSIADQLDQAQERARKEHEELAQKNPAAADEIYQFESVDDVKARVLRIAKKR